LLILVIAPGAALNLVVLLSALRHPVLLNSDFLAFWSFPRFAAAHPVRLLYDAGALQAFQKQLYPGFGSFYPYLYPPTLLLAIWWLRDFAFAQAQALWTVAGLVALAGAVRLWPQHRRVLLVALLASPAALLSAATGETGFFTTSLMMAGLALLPTRPRLAGIAFGLLTLKPQLGLLIPFFLLARGDWAAIITAGLTAAALVIASCLAFPPGLWAVWAHALPIYQYQYFAGTNLNLNIIVTPAANLRSLGVPLTAAGAIQGLVSLAVIALVWLAARSTRHERAMAALLAGSFIAVPHAYAYDTMPLVIAMSLCLSPRTPLWQGALGAILYAAPLLLLTPLAPWFLYALPETLLFTIIITSSLQPSSLPAASPKMSY